MCYGEPLIQDPAFKSKIANAELELNSLEYTEPVSYTHLRAHET